MKHFKTNVADETEAERDIRQARIERAAKLTREQAAELRKRAARLDKALK